MRILAQSRFGLAASSLAGAALIALLLGIAVPLATDGGTAMAFDAPPKDQGHTGSGGDGPDDENPDDPDQDDEGDPVQLKTGNFKMTVEDALLDSYALPISMQRIYNNLDALNDGPFGRGWSTSYVMSIGEVARTVALASSGGSSGQIAAISLTTEVVLRDDTGARHTFTEGPNGTWVSERARFGTLVKTGSDRFTWTRRDGLQFRFVSGRLDRAIDTNGNELVVTYDGAGRIARVTNPAGRFLDYTYNAASKVAAITDNLGRTVSYGYNAENLLTTVTNQLGNVTTYGYDAQNRLNSITSAEGQQVLSNTYDSAGRVTQQTAYGASFTYTYNPTYTRVRNSRGFFSDHYFNGFGNPIQRRDLRGGNRYWTWDADGNKLTERDQRNNTTSFSYTADGDIATVTAPDGGVSTLTYGPLARVTSVTDPLGRTATMAYDANGNLTSVTDPLGQTETFTYDSAGRIQTATDEAGNVATYAYNAAGDLLSLTDENGLAETMERDAVGRIIAETNAAGERTAFSFNARNRMLSYTDPLGQVTTFAYNANDERISETDPLGQATSQAFDAFGRLVSASDGLGNTTSFEYDSMANLVRITDPEGRQATRSYDAGNLLVGVTRPDSSTVGYAYDAVGNMTRITDPRGNLTDLSYDTMDRVTTITYADGTTMTRAYDLAGRLTQVVDRKGLAFTYSYDDLDRMAQITLPNDGTITYAYDSGDNLVTVTGYEGTVAYTYDAGDRTTSEAGVWGDVLSYAYDLANRVTQVERPGRYSLTYAFDADGRMRQATAPSGTTDYTYDADDRLVFEQMPNGVTATYAYDAADRMTAVTHTAPDGTTVLMSNTYSYDQSGLITSMTEADGTVHGYTYDGMLRLVAETITPAGGGAPSTTTWSYDPNGNRLTQDVDGTVTTYTYNTVDELTADSSGVTYSYDESGNLLTAVTAASTDTYSYDDLNRMTGLAAAGSSPLAYGYDGLGTRVRRTDGSNDTREVRWGRVLIEEKDATSATLARYDHGLGPTAIAGGFGTRHYLFDGIGHTRGLADTVGALTDRYTFSAHGTNVAQTGSTPNPFVFNGASGYYYEGRGDFYHVGARFYAGGVGRFVQTDPVRQGMNPYRHAMNNPVNFNDPSGEILPLLAWCARGAASSLVEDEITHHLFDGKEERTWTDRAFSAGLGCLTGGFGGRARRAANAADAASDAARRCRGGRCNVCSFDGDMQVLTDSGPVRIDAIDPDNMQVLSKDEITGEVHYRDILDHYSNAYDTTVRIQVRDPDDGSTQTLVANTIHPFFAVPANPRPAMSSAENQSYVGEIPGGAWVDSADLRPGDLLLTSNGTFSEVVSVAIKDEPLLAWNMNVDVSDSYFVTADAADDAVWVHNCNHIKKPPRGRGSTPKDQRDPKRTYTKKDKETRHDETGGRCEQCGDSKDISEIDGHHIDRHADGGPTTPDNQANVCKDCHKDLHRP